MVEIIEKNPKVVGITAAMPDGTGLDIFREKIPQNYYDVGIAEEHAVTFAAGLATQGSNSCCCNLLNFSTKSL